MVGTALKAIFRVIRERSTSRAKKGVASRNQSKGVMVGLGYSVKF
jgi:hypothetical protein